MVCRYTAYEAREAQLLEHQLVNVTTMVRCLHLHLQMLLISRGLDMRLYA